MAHDLLISTRTEHHLTGAATILHESSRNSVIIFKQSRWQSSLHSLRTLSSNYSLPRCFVLKVYKDHPNNFPAEDRMARELAAYTRMKRHQGVLVPRCYGQVRLEQQSTAAIAIQLIHGTTLCYGDLRLASKSQREWTRACITACYDAASSCGITHNDMKPENLIRIKTAGVVYRISVACCGSAFLLLGYYENLAFPLCWTLSALCCYALVFHATDRVMLLDWDASELHKDDCSSINRADAAMVMRELVGDER